MDISKRGALAGLLAIAARPGLAAPRTTRRPGRYAGFEAAASRAVAGRAAPGLQVCLRRRDAADLSKGFGSADLETATPMTAAAVCRIGSLTKQFTASVVLQLASEGKLSLDDMLSVYLPDFPNAQRLSLRRMLSHTSGLGNYTAVAPKVFLQLSRTDRDTAALVEAMKPTSQTLAYEPGTDWRYSNTGYVLLGVVIERVAGKPYAEAMRERLFAPLRLSATAVDDAAEVVPHRASGYTSDAKAPTGFDNASFIAMSWPGGAGSMRSTAEDLCAWHKALLGGRVLQPEMLKAMLTPATLNDGKLPSAPDGKGGRTPIRYGFGVQFGEFQGRRMITHSGGIQGFSSILESFPDDGGTWAMLINTDSPQRAAQVELITAARTAVVGA